MKRTLEAAMQMFKNEPCIALGRDAIPEMVKVVLARLRRILKATYQNLKGSNFQNRSATKNEAKERL